MKLWRFFPLWVLALGLTTSDAPALSSEDQARVAAARENRFPHYADRLAVFLREAPEVEPGGIVFLGDSITEAFPTGEAFPGRNVLNHGIGGDRIGGVRERIDLSAALPQPRRLFLMIGINDIVGTPGVPVSDLAKQYGLLLDELREAAPETEIVVQYLLPLSGRLAEHNERVRDMNREIRRLADQRDLPYLDLHWHLRDENGELHPDFTFDGIHLTVEGYWAWLEAFFTPAELAAAAPGFARPWVDLHQKKRRVQHLDPSGSSPFPGHRGVDDLVVFTPAHRKPTTGTNPWGLEAVVENGVVTHLGGNDSPIPPNGFVVSGHGRAARWIAVNLRPGTKVSLEDDRLMIGGGSDSLSVLPRDRLRRLRTALFQTVLDWSDQGKETANHPGLRQIFAQARKLGAPGAEPDAGALAELEQRLTNLTVGLPEL